MAADFQRSSENACARKFTGVSLCKQDFTSLSSQTVVHMNACGWAAWKVVFTFHTPALLPSCAASPALTCSQRLGKRQKALLCKPGRLSKISFWSCLSYLQMSAVCYSWALLLSLRQFVGSIWKWRWI